MEGYEVSERLGNLMGVSIPKIKNGSKVSVGKLYTVTFNIDHHFNWFQKKMIKWCFGLTVEDYTEE